MKKLSVYFTLVCLCMGLAHADILIGQSLDLSNANSSFAKESSQGAKFYLDAINQNGGVHGQSIQLVQKDDEFNIKQTYENVRSFIKNPDILGLFLISGTPHVEGIIPLLDANAIALIAPTSGAMSLHQPVKKHVFNVRSTYQFEAQKTIVQLSTMALSRIAVIHVDDSFGRDAVWGYYKGFELSNLQPTFIINYKPEQFGCKDFIEKSKTDNPQAVVIAGSGSEVVNCIKFIRNNGWVGTIATLSNNATKGFILDLGKWASGVVVSQVFPHERSFSSKLVQDITNIAKQNKITEITPAMIEGYASAQVLVQALQKAGPKPTRAKLLKALSSLSFNIGEFSLSYSDKDHTGLNFADLSIINKDGYFIR